MTRASLLGAAAPIVLAVAALAGAGGAHAQTAATPAQPQPTSDVPTPADNVGEIIVTAQRRSERLERTPVSVSVLSADRLAEQNIVTERDLQLSTPGLIVRATGSSNQQNFAIRGQSLDAFSGTRPGVLPYIDEVQIGGFGSATSFYDLQSVQVLKGPQGTLFGRNSTGGAVLFTTAKPTYNMNGYAEAQGGNYGFYNLEGAVTLPVVADKLAIRVAGFRTERDGFQYNLYRNRREGAVDRYGGRVSVLADLTPKLQNTLVVDYSRSFGGSTSGVLYNTVPTAVTPLASTVLFSPTLDLAFGFPGAFSAYLAAHPKADPAGVNVFAAEQRARGPFVTNLDGPNYIRAENLIVSNITSYSLGPDTTLRNILGYTKLHDQLGIDQDATPYGIFTSAGREQNGYNFNQSQISEELQITGKAVGGRLAYVAGGYYADEKNYNNDLTFVLDLSPLSAPISQVNASNSYSKTYAAYAQGTYDLSDLTGVQGLGVITGLRYTHERNRLSILPQDSASGLETLFPTVYRNNQAKSTENVGYTAGLQEQLTSNLLFYVTSRRSYKAGGFNNSQPPQIGSGVTGGNSYGQQTVTDVEGGAKFAGHLGGVPVRADLAVFNTWVSNEQRVAYVISNGFPAGITVNVPRSKVTGVEVDGQVSPFKWLTLGGALTYTDARFTRNSVTVLAPPAVRFTSYPDTPDVSGSLTADITYPLTERFRLDVHGDVYAQTRTYFTPLGSTNPSARIPGYAIANFRVAVEDTKSGWSLAALVKNAFDRTYYVGGFAFAPVVQLNSVIPGDPRTYFAELKYKF